MINQNCPSPLITPALKLACSNCKLRELCLPVALPEDDLLSLDALVTSRPMIERGEKLFRQGDPFRAIYIVRTGFFKNSTCAPDGQNQVTGFQMAGELLGLDGIGTDHHACDATALEDSQVCLITLDQLEKVSREFIPLQRQFHKIMSREIVRDHEIMVSLGSMTAEKRLAAFLLDLLRRLTARGFSSSEMRLRMTREEIGSYLGLKVETVSRAFSKLQVEGLLRVDNRHVHILNEQSLIGLVGTR